MGGVERKKLTLPESWVFEMSLGAAPTIGLVLTRAKMATKMDYGFCCLKYKARLALAARATQPAVGRDSSTVFFDSLKITIV